MDSFEAQDKMFGGPDNRYYECSNEKNLEFYKTENERLEAENKKLIDCVKWYAQLGGEHRCYGANNIVRITHGFSTKARQALEQLKEE